MRLSKKEKLRRLRISRALKKRNSKKKKAAKRISKALKLYHQTGLTAAEREVLAPIIWPEDPEKAWEKPKRIEVPLIVPGEAPPEKAVEVPLITPSEALPERAVEAPLIVPMEAVDMMKRKGARFLPPKLPAEEPPGLAESILQRIEDNLHYAASQVAGYSPNISVAQNSDGSIDGEIVISGWSTWDESRDASIDLEGAIAEIPGVWISVGARFAGPAKLASEKHGAYDRYKGLFQVMAHSQRGFKKSLNFVTARQMMVTMKKNGKRMPEQIVVRLSWKPGGERPK